MMATLAFSELRLRAFGYFKKSDIVKKNKLFEVFLNLC